MELPRLLELTDETHYHDHYLTTLVNGECVETPDGVCIRFFPERFHHAFFRSRDKWQYDKSVFDRKRAQRMDWIRTLLCDPNAEVYREPAARDQFNRLVLHRAERFIVVTVTIRPGLEKFVTAYSDVSEEKMAHISRLPRWSLKKA